PFSTSLLPQRIRGATQPAVAKTLDRRRRVDESCDGLQTAVISDDAEVGATQVERRLRRAAGGPAESDVAVVGFDAADQVQLVTRELGLGGGDHRVDFGVSAAATVRIDIAAILGPDPRDQRAAASRVTFVPYGEISDHQLVDVAHTGLSD